jgi:hypothetical protein
MTSELSFGTSELEFFVISFSFFWFEQDSTIATKASKQTDFILLVYLIISDFNINNGCESKECRAIKKRKAPVIK